jgi:mRNA-degrading endonuclease RelE of RelBE toxin-antitoxin system
LYEIRFTPIAEQQLRDFRKADQVRIVDVVERQLTHEPNAPSRNRKVLRNPRIAQRGLRAGAFRVFYEVDETGRRVTINATGVKRGNRLFIAVEEIEL